jgi:hypothetical protein
MDGNKTEESERKKESRRNKAEFRRLEAQEKEGKSADEEMVTCQGQNKTGKVYSLEYNKIPKVFTPQHVGRCCNVTVASYSIISLTYSHVKRVECPPPRQAGRVSR